MDSVVIDEVLDKLPTNELDETLGEFVAPFTEVLPDERLRRVVPLAVRGIVAGETPVITAMARSVERTESSTWAAAKRIYRFLENRRLPARVLKEGLYRCAQATIEEEEPDYLVVALDPVNFEKPYTHESEGVSTVHKSTPPDRHGKARLARGYPAITATVVNTRVPATTYANWFSYTTGFISENREIHRAIGTTGQLFPKRRVRFVCDSGLDDQKIFEWMGQEEEAEFVIRASHLERLVEVYNRRLDRWEQESLRDLVETVPLAAESWQVAFSHAGVSRMAAIRVGWLELRLPETHQRMWAVVAEEYDRAAEQQEEKEEEEEEEEAARTLVLLSDVPVANTGDARALYADWRLKGRIEHGYRFCQEAGLDVEEMRVRSLERMRRLFILVLLAMQFVMHLMERWPPVAIRWLRQLGGKLGLQIDRDGPYLLLRGLSAVWRTVMTLSHLAVCPFPREAFR
jgi:hypothetical protein